MVHAGSTSKLSVHGDPAARHIVATVMIEVQALYRLATTAETGESMAAPSLSVHRIHHHNQNRYISGTCPITLLPYLASVGVLSASHS